nr:MAG TPA: hypothetical protein [Caudoviricetes sp.]DAV07855.1 MAG TPA: hypothetical protein [Caudoviricetes sp.]
MRRTARSIIAAGSSRKNSFTGPFSSANIGSHP